MSQVYFIGDLHLGHVNVLKWRHGFPPDCTVEEHDQIVAEAVARKINKRDTLFLLGDIFFTNREVFRWAEAFARGNVHFIMGNHDLERCSQIEKKEALAFLISLGYNIYGLCKRKNIWVSHCPVHEAEMRGKFNVHGHVHRATLEDPRFVNVSWDNCFNGEPVEIREINRHLNEGIIYKGNVK